MEQKVIIFNVEAKYELLTNYQLDKCISEYSVNGWKVHQIQPTKFKKSNSGDLILKSAVIILNRNNEK